MGEKLTPINREILELLPSLRAFARSLTRSPADADDLVQETLTRALTNIRQFTPGTNLRAWLFTIQRNRFYAICSKRSREPAVMVDDIQWAREAPSQLWSVMLSDVDRGFNRLPSEQREALMLVGGNGLSYEEAAEICGCAVGTIKSRVSRARSALLQLLESSDHIEFLSDAEAPVLPEYGPPGGRG
ncbi:sigma-70 family RNA polymerase sigma factor [Thalassobaculum sp.]|uniref:sigma-70 family RNA polymerase sigma factor n=1 Tax=Thalassobaculum sp. TaxID=2022740 RepID=UPI0032F0274A